MSERAVELRRRGVRHGKFAAPEARAVVGWRDPEFRAACEELWREDRPIVLQGALGGTEKRFAGPIKRSLTTFERMRRGASFQDDVWKRLDGVRAFRPAGATVDAGDTREIEKVFADGMNGSRAVARDLYAKLSWVAHDERDRSVRVRFSFGSEALLDWQQETRRAPWADRFAESVFPECRAITGRRELVDLIEQLIGRRARFSERIVYSNAPGGGALFHHDDEEHQLGVVFTQLQGETGWFALPKRELAAYVAASARGALRRRAGTARRALRALDDVNDPQLSKLLNATPSFTSLLAERGAFFHVRAGDSILLPSHGPDDVCWHAVYGLGRAPSLAHSYGIFALRR
jgi:hypothetical protein